MGSDGDGGEAEGAEGEVEGENHGIRLAEMPSCDEPIHPFVHTFVHPACPGQAISTFRLARRSRTQGAVMGDLACCGVAAAIPSSTTVCERPCLDGRGIPSHPPHT